MKKILTMAIAALMLISMTGCGGSKEDDTLKKQEKVIETFFTYIKEYKLDELEKLGSDDYAEVLDVDSFTEQFEQFTDEEMYGETFVQETDNFIKNVFSKLIKEYKMSTDKKAENTIIVKGKRFDEKSLNMNAAQENVKQLAQKYQEEHMEELSALYLEKGQDAMMQKIFNDLSKDMYAEFNKELDSAKYTDFTFKFKMIEKDGKWIIDEISEEK